MPPKEAAFSSPNAAWSRRLTLFALVGAALSALFYYLDAQLESFYIFSPPQLRDLSTRALGAHGNDTRRVVEFIISELNDKLPDGYVNLDEEWIFNNAGGAMGAMYVIHASKLKNDLHGGLGWMGRRPFHHMTGMKERMRSLTLARHHGVSDHLRYVNGKQISLIYTDIHLGTAIGTEGHTGI